MYHTVKHITLFGANCCWWCSCKQKNKTKQENLQLFKANLYCSVDSGMMSLVVCPKVWLCERYSKGRDRWARCSVCIACSIFAVGMFSLEMGHQILQDISAFSVCLPVGTVFSVRGVFVAVIQYSSRTHHSNRVVLNRSTLHLFFATNKTPMQFMVFIPYFSASRVRHKSLCVKICPPYNVQLFLCCACKIVIFSPQCWCGDAYTDYDKHGRSDRCNYRCSGDDDQRCGGHDAMNVYAYPDKDVADHAARVGCYKDVGDDRIMRGKYTSEHMTNEVISQALELDGYLRWRVLP